METSWTRQPTRPVVLAAFEGWNDAGEAASTAVSFLADACDAEEIAAVDPEEYYDFQVNRPTISLDEGGVHRLEWPTTRVLAGRLGNSGPDVVLVRGIEPSVRWRHFAEELAAVCDSLEASVVVLLGALLADTPHGRPVPVTGVSATDELTTRLRLQPASYTGPTGIVGVLADVLARRGHPVVSYWASVPYYVGQPPNPKATLALLRRIEDVLDTPLDLGELPDEAQAWERAVDEMVADDDELGGLVQQLEEQADSEGMESASGDDIAAEFERYLRRRRPDGAG
jgi:predicted ATP-grasp superfamily ATP-dependent carboligase